jgi:hypothetical protein
MTTTYVTAFIDIPTLEGSTTRRKADEYIRVSKELLAQDIFLVFYGDATMAEHVRAERESHGLLAAKTVIIPMAFTELPTYRYHTDIVAAIATHGIFGAPTCGRFTPAYLVTILAKPLLLQQTASMNPFNTTHFCWHDFGFYHLKSTYWSAFSKITPSLYPEIDRTWSAAHRIKIGLVKPFAHLLTATPEELCRTDQNVVAGAFFGGDIAAIDWLAHTYATEVESLLYRRLITNEEGVLAAVFARNPSHFDVNACYYTTCVPSFASTRSGPERIGRQLAGIHKLGWHDHVIQLVWKALAGLQQGHVTYDEESLRYMFTLYLEALAVVNPAKIPFVEAEARHRGILTDASKFSWTFAPNTDSQYGDSRQVLPPFTLADLFEAAETTPGCVGFNSNGWLKHTIYTPLKHTSASSMFLRSAPV